MNENATKPAGKKILGPMAVVWLGVLFCSLSGIFVRYSTAPSLVLAAYRKTFVTLMLLPFALKNHRAEIRGLGKKNLLLCALSGTFLGFHFFTYFESVVNTSMAASQVLVCLEVLFVALFMLISGKERYTGLARAGILAAIGGSVLVAWTGGGDGITTMYGNGMALLAALLLASYSYIGTEVRKVCSNTAYTFLVYGMAALVLNVMIPLQGYSYTGYGTINYLTGLGMAVFCSLLGHSLFNWTLKYLSPTLVAMIKIFQPVFAVAWAVILFAEIPVWNQWVGGLVVIAGILLYTRAMGQKEKGENQGQAG